MPLILDLRTTRPNQATRPHHQDATATRLLGDVAERITRQYGPAAVLTATADALTYYLANVQPYESAGTSHGYEAVTQAIRECRQAADALRREAAEMLTRS